MRLYKISLSFFMLFMIVISSISNSVVHAYTRSRDISSTALTSLTVSSNDIMDGGNTTVNLTFDDTRGKIQKGDYITVTWNSTGDVFFQGYKKTFPLKVDNHVVGEAEITTTGATLTFNDAVEKLQNIKGSAYFEVQGRNITLGDQVDKKVVSIISGNTTVDVTITKPASGKTGVFYYKTGDMLPDDTQHVRWFLLVNNEKVHVDDRVYIEDKIQGGQELDPSSFSITVTGHRNEYYVGETAIQDFERDFTGASIVYSKEKNEITVTLPKDIVSLNNFSIMYRTKIVNVNQASFENHTKAWYKEYGQPAVEGNDFNHSVKNINSGANITGTVQGELRIHKVVEGTKTPIAGVTFKVMKKDGSIIKDGKTELDIVTNKDGIADVKDLSVGQYIVKEVSAPDWIFYDPMTAATLEFEVKLTDLEGYVFEVENRIKSTSIPVEKKWIGPKQDEVTVSLYADDQEVATLTLHEKNQWKDTFKDLPLYTQTGKKITYTVKEKEVNGYTSNITGNQETGFVVTNTNVETIDIPVEKHWIGKEGTQVEIVLYADGVEKDQLVLSKGNDWILEFKNLLKYDQTTGKEITYTIKEKEVNGYTSSITGNQETGFVVTNTQILPTEEVENDQDKDVSEKEDMITKEDEDIIVEIGEVTEKEEDPNGRSEDISQEIEKHTIQKDTNKEDKVVITEKNQMNHPEKEVVNTSDSTNKVWYIGCMVLSIMSMIGLRYAALKLKKH